MNMLKMKHNFKTKIFFCFNLMYAYLFLNTLLRIEGPLKIIVPGARLWATSMPSYIKRENFENLFDFSASHPQKKKFLDPRSIVIVVACALRRVRCPRKTRYCFCYFLDDARVDTLFYVSLDITEQWRSRRTHNATEHVLARASHCGARRQRVRLNDTYIYIIYINIVLYRIYIIYTTPTTPPYTYPAPDLGSPPIGPGHDKHIIWFIFKLYHPAKKKTKTVV